MRQEPGFTLIETLVVLAIITILGMMTCGCLRSWLTTYKVNGAARRLFTEMNIARSRAIAENNCYVVSFDTDRNCYRIYDDNNNDFTPSAPDQSELLKTVYLDTNYEGIEFGYVAGKSPSGKTINGAVRFGSTNPPRLVFRPSGLVRTFGTAYLKPAEDLARKDRERAVSVNFCGRIRIYTHLAKEDGWE